MNLRCAFDVNSSPDHQGCCTRSRTSKEAPRLHLPSWCACLSVCTAGGWVLHQSFLRLRGERIRKRQRKKKGGGWLARPQRDCLRSSRAKSLSQRTCGNEEEVRTFFLPRTSHRILPGPSPFPPDRLLATVSLSLSTPSLSLSALSGTIAVSRVSRTPALLLLSSA